MQYLNFWLGRNFYRDINLYFTYDTQYKKWFTTGTEFLYHAMAEIINENSFDLWKVLKNIIFKKRGNGYVIGSRDQRQKLGHRAYLMSLIWKNDNIIIAKNEIFYTAPRSLRGKNSFLDKMNFFRRL